MAEPMNQLGQWASDQVLGSWLLVNTHTSLVGPSYVLVIY